MKHSGEIFHLSVLAVRLPELCRDDGEMHDCRLPAAWNDCIKRSTRGKAGGKIRNMSSRMTDSCRQVNSWKSSKGKKIVCCSAEGEEAVTVSHNEKRKSGKRVQEEGAAHTFSTSNHWWSRLLRIRSIRSSPSPAVPRHRSSSCLPHISPSCSQSHSISFF